MLGSCPCPARGSDTWRPPCLQGPIANRLFTAFVAPSALIYLQAMTVSETKEILRREFLARRSCIDEDSRLAQQAQIAGFFLDRIRLDGPKIIAGYWPVRGEVDVLPLLRDLLRHGHRAALPVVNGCDEALAFYNWHDGAVMRMAGFGIPEPVGTAADAVLPDVIVTPLLVFDRQGYRLGYGRGMYDRFLHHVRARKSVITVGVGFAEQECGALPHDANDQRLDWILTGREALAF